VTVRVAGRRDEIRTGTTTAGIGAFVFGVVAAHAEAVLHQCDSQAGLGPVLGGVRGVEEVGEEEADELEGHADHPVPEEGEEGADGEAVDEDVVGGGGAVCEDRGFPVWRGGVGGGLFVGLGVEVSGYSVGLKDFVACSHAGFLREVSLRVLRRVGTWRLGWRRRRHGRLRCRHRRAFDRW